GRRPRDEGPRGERATGRVRPTAVPPGALASPLGPPPMFCRSCWANLPDGSERCPKCQQDPRVPSAAPAPSPPAAAPPPPLPAVAPAPPPRGTSLARLNVALAAVLVLGVAGPFLMRWWETSRAAPPAAGTGSAVVADPLPEPDLPRVA